MSDPDAAMFLYHDVKWRAYPDGVVVYVPSTCETYVLSPRFAAFFRSIGSSPYRTAGVVNTLASEYSADPSQAISSQNIEELAALKILDAGN